ncbi:MAG: Gfo/Idh/MocA family oxidoreductase, partial [Armatimonadota bacterium]
MDHPMLLEQSIHHLDLLRYVYGMEAETVTCMTWNPPGSHFRGDACAAALIRFTGGLIAVYHGTWVSGSDTLAFRWRTDFERGVIIQRELFGDLTEGAISDTQLKVVPLPAFEPFTDDSAALLEDVIAALKADRPFACSGHDHLRTLALTLACVESSRTGKPVALEQYAVGLDAHP